MYTNVYRTTSPVLQLPPLRPHVLRPARLRSGRRCLSTFKQSSRSSPHEGHAAFLTVGYFCRTARRSGRVLLETPGGASVSSELFSPVPSQDPTACPRPRPFFSPPSPTRARTSNGRQLRPAQHAQARPGRGGDDRTWCREAPDPRRRRVLQGGAFRHGAWGGVRALSGLGMDRSQRALCFLLEACFRRSCRAVRQESTQPTRAWSSSSGEPSSQWA